MLSIKNLTERTDSGAVTVLGFFDGVHKGHESLFLAARKKAAELGLILCVFTFSSLPTKKTSETRILTAKERDRVFLNLGVDRVYTVDFKDVCDMNAESFVSDVLIGKINTRVAFCGEKFRFGKDAAYGFDSLKKEMAAHSGDALSVPELSFENEKISTSRIKELITSGNVRLANSLLSCDFFFESAVVHGRGVGKTLGFPTLNLEIPNEKIKPKNGVYKSRVRYMGKEHPAITNVGTCPTFGKHDVHVESFILDGEAELYSETVEVYLEDFIREETCFENDALLREQIRKDIEKCQ